MPNTTKSDKQAHLKQRLKQLPNLPGVYKMLGREGELLYVGKAKSLKSRVASYFGKTHDHPKTLALVQRICDIEIIVVRGETEALLLEQNLIKQHRPPYNVMLRDDKSYLYVYVSKDTYPRLAIGRGKGNHGQGRFFGPYPSANNAKQIVLLMQKLFRLRTCSNNEFAKRKRPCLEYQIKRCTAPCVGLIDQQSYGNDVADTLAFLTGKTNDVKHTLTQKMQGCAEAMDFEQAAFYRDRLIMLNEIQAKQAVYKTHGEADVMAIISGTGVVCVHVLTVRGGQVLGGKNYFVDEIVVTDDTIANDTDVDDGVDTGIDTDVNDGSVNQCAVAMIDNNAQLSTDLNLSINQPSDTQISTNQSSTNQISDDKTTNSHTNPNNADNNLVIGGNDSKPKADDAPNSHSQANQTVGVDSRNSEYLQRFLLSFYRDVSDDVPSEIIISEPISDKASIEILLGEQRGTKPAIKHSVRAYRKEWLDIATLNAQNALQSKLSDYNELKQRFFALKTLLDDVSDKTIERIECFDISHTMGEAAIGSCVVFDTGGARKRDYRQYAIHDITGGDDYAAMRQVLHRRYSKHPLPDLLLVDGGKGQLGVAKDVLENLGKLNETLLISVAKGEGRKAGLEVLHFLYHAPIDLPSDHKALHLIMHIRDEAHRFAITNHRKKRDKARGASVLEVIPGLGAKRRRDLLAHFGGLSQLLGASQAEIAGVKGIGKVLAGTIYKALHS